MGLNAKPIRPTHPELTGSNNRTLNLAIRHHYQIARHLDEQVDAAYRALIQEEHFSQTTLDALTAERNNAHEILRLYLAEAIRRRKEHARDQQAMPTR